MNRLEALNQYTSKEIKAYSGEDVENPIIIVGNILSRKRIEDSILGHKLTIVSGPVCSGKLTIVKDICDRNNLPFKVSYNGVGFGELPYYSDDLFIIRNPKKKDYIKANLPVVLLYDSAVEGIRILPPSKGDMARYETLKGCPMVLNSNTISPLEKEKILVNKSLRKGISEEMMPKNIHRWIARNFNNKANILKLCNLAQHVKDRTIYWALMRLVKYPRSLDLKYPKWVKRK